MSKKTKLKNLVITKVALCDEGACSEAHIQLYKRKGDNKSMEFDDILKTLSEEEQKIVKAKIDALEEARMKAEEDKKKMEEEAAKEDKGMKKSKEETEEDILKNVDPAIKDMIEKSRLQAQAAEEAVRKMKEAQVERESLAKVSPLKSLGNTEQLLQVYKTLHASNEELCENFFNELTKANSMIEKSTLLDEVGTSHSTESTGGSWKLIENEADNLVSKQKGLTRAEAINKVLQEKPELYEQYLKEEEE